jgi:isoquinoline 1-oxidoreductase subunit beta
MDLMTPPDSKPAPSSNARSALKPKMPKLPTRRAFLIGAAASIGLVIGYTVWPRSTKLNLTIRPDETALGGWLKIGKDGRVVVVVPQAEMGQGVYTALPQILADELGADWASVAVEPAPFHPLYVNKGIIADAMDAVPGAFQGMAKWAIEEVLERYVVHLTGGSTSIRGFHDTLREAGAIARGLLCKAAAKRWNVDWQECTTQGGRVLHADKSLSFAELAVEAAEQVPPAEPHMRPASERNLVGRSLPRIDIPAKCDGSAVYGMDIRLPGMVYAAIRAAPFGSNVRINREQVPPGNGLINVVDGPGWVAAVADRYWIAKQVLDKLEVSFNAGFSQNVDSAWITGRLNRAMETGEATLYEEAGDVDAALTANAKALTRVDYTLPYLAHACLEPMTATARLNKDGTVEIWAPTQSVTLVVWQVAAALGIEEERIRVYPTLLGGGFGRKAETDVCVQAALLARDVQRPVQLIWSRTEDLRQDKYRPAGLARMQAALDDQGKINVFTARLVSQSPSRSFMSRNAPAIKGGDKEPSTVQGAVKLPYLLPTHRISHIEPDLPVPVGFWRSVGHSLNAFFIETFMDELAAKAKQTPLAFRLAHLPKDSRAAAVLTAAAQLAGPKVAGRGRGIALAESFGSYVAVVVEVAPDGTGIAAKRAWAAVDCGPVIHPDIVTAQIEGGIIDGIGAAMFGKVDFAAGYATAENFDGYPLISLTQAPDVDVTLLPSTAAIGGVGEIGLPPAAPALANAIFDLTGKRVRSLPISDLKLVDAGTAGLASDQQLLGGAASPAAVQQMPMVETPQIGNAPQ